MSTIIDPILDDPILDEGDKDKFKHIVVPADAVTEAYITGSTVTALCGKTWVPTRDPDKFGICPTCKEQFERVFGRPWG